MDTGSSVAGSDTISDGATPVASTSALKQDPSPESLANKKPVIDLDQLERSFKTWMRVIRRQTTLLLFTSIHRHQLMRQVYRKI